MFLLTYQWKWKRVPCIAVIHLWKNFPRLFLLHRRNQRQSPPFLLLVEETFGILVYRKMNALKRWCHKPRVHSWCQGHQHHHT